MGSKAEEALLIRRYLLGETTEKETQGLEERVMVDADLLSQLISEEEGLLEDYLEERMSDDLRREFERSFLSTPQGRQQVLLTRELMGYSSTDQQQSLTPVARDRKTFAWSTALANPFLRIAASVFVVAGLAFGIYRSFFYLSDTDKGMAELRRAYQDRRPTEARLSGFAYAPWSAQRGQGAADTGYAERLLLDAVHDHPGPQSHHALGVFYLTQREFDKAVAEFELAAKYSSSDAELQGDWGTALFERGRERQDIRGGKAVEDFAKSLEHFQKALQFDSARLDVLFNLALLYEAQGLPERARETWDEYLKRDSKSKWADEARERQQQLQERQGSSLLSKEELLSQFVEAYGNNDQERAWKLLRGSREPPAGKSVAEQLLDSYLDHSLQGETNEARSAFDILSYAGALEYQRARECYTRTLVEFYEKQPASNLRLLGQARDLTQKGHRHNSEDQSALAIEAYTRAKNIFVRLGDEAEAVANEYWIAYCYADMFDSRTSLPILQKLEQICEGNQFRWLHARSLSATAANHYVQKKYSEAARGYEAALNEAEAMDDPISILNSLDSLTELYRSIGNHPRSFECIQRGFLPALTSPLTPDQRLRHFSIVASALAAADLWEAALAYQEEGLKGDGSSVQINAAVAYAHLSALYARRNNYAEASKSIQLAYDLVGHIENERRRETLTAYSSLFLAHIYRGLQDYDRAIATYTDTIETFGKLSIPVISYQAHKGRLYCYIAGQNNPLIQGELDATITILEADRLNILETDDRNSFFDMEQSIYDIAINYAHSNLRDDYRAFAYSESSRARSLLDLMKGGAAPAGEQNSSALSSLDAAKTVCIVPDKILSYLPFEALRNPDSQSYLLEDFNLCYAPSASVFIACSEKAQKKESTGSGHLLIVGDPAFDREAFPGLERLRSAKREAEKIAQFYGNRTVLTADEVQEERVKSEMAKSTVIHIAAHALPDEFAPLQSRFLLAKELGDSRTHPGSDGIFEALEIYRIRMPQTQLAVLSLGISRRSSGWISLFCLVRNSS